MIIANTEVILTSLSSGIASMTKESDFLRHGGDMSDLNYKSIINKYYIVILQTPFNHGTTSSTTATSSIYYFMV